VPRSVRNLKSCARNRERLGSYSSEAVEAAEDGACGSESEVVGVGGEAGLLVRGIQSHAHNRKCRGSETEAVEAA
jgi:hypothetical protein